MRGTLQGLFDDGDDGNVIYDRVEGITCTKLEVMLRVVMTLELLLVRLIVPGT